MNPPVDPLIEQFAIQLAPLGVEPEDVPFLLDLLKQLPDTNSAELLGLLNAPLTEQLPDTDSAMQFLVCLVPAISMARLLRLRAEGRYRELVVRILKPLGLDGSRPSGEWIPSLQDAMTEIPHLTRGVLSMVGEALNLMGDYRGATAVTLAVLGKPILRSDAAPGELLDRVHLTFIETPPDWRLQYVAALALTLANANHALTAAILLWQSACPKTTSKGLVLCGLEGVGAETRAQVVIALAMALADLGLNRTGVAVLAGDVGLPLASLADGRLLPALGEQSRRMALGRISTWSGLADQYMAAVTQTLEACGVREAGTIAETFLGLSSGNYPSPTQLADILNQHQMWVESRVTLCSALSESLSHMGRKADALTVLLAAVGLPALPFPDDVKVRIAAFAESKSANNAAALLALLIMRLRDRHHDAEMLAVTDICIRLFVEESQADNMISPSVLAALVEAWLSAFGMADCGRALRVCESAIMQLRRRFTERRDQSAEYRSDLTQRTDALRRRIVDIALWHADRAPNQATQLRVRAAVWHAELSNRLLVESLLAAPPQELPTEGGQLKEGWPYAEKDKEPFTGHIPLPARLDQAGSAALCLGSAPPAEVVGPPQDELALWMERVDQLASNTMSQPESAPMPGWVGDARRLIDHGLSEEDLARELTPTSVLLRAVCLPDGELSWSAFGSENGRLRELASGRGRPGNRNRLRWAAALHDATLDLSWEACAGSLGEVDAICRVAQELNDITDRITKAAQKDTQKDAQQNLDRELDGLWRDFAAVFSRHGLEEMGRRHALLFRSLLAPNDLGGWERYRQIVQSFADTPGGDVRSRLRGATQELLRSVGAVWDLRSLLPHLDAARTDLVIQVDDALHSIPVAHLCPGGGEPLFRRVRSVRVSLSPLIERLQHEWEQKWEQEPPPGLASLSWFESEDTAGRNAARILHCGHSNLAKDHNLLWDSAAEVPPGQRGSLAQGLADRHGFLLVSVCGHGGWPGGVKLQDPLPWTGDGCRLNQVELLLLVSCSIGRLAQTGELDLEGFVVNLIRHQARSVLAFRWPVHAAEAACFANEVARQYLELRCRSSPTPETCLRAQAVNAARKALLPAQNNGGLHCGLNTVAAADLHGLG